MPAVASIWRGAVGVLKEGDDTHLCFPCGALERTDCAGALYARSPTTPRKILPIVSICTFSSRRREFSAFTSRPTGVPFIVPGERRVSLFDVRRERCQKLWIIKLISCSVFSYMCDDVVWHRELLEREGSSMWRARKLRVSEMRPFYRAASLFFRPVICSQVLL
jgi:hypothetical protein